MKSWLEIEHWLFPISLLIALVSLGLLPTIEVANEFYGGGVIREWAFNQVFLSLTPFAYRSQVVSWWQAASYAEEAALYTLFAFNAFVGLLPVIYGIMKLKIEGGNWYVLSVFASKQKVIKGK